MLRMHAVTCINSLPSLSLELDPGTSGIGIDALTIVRSATVFHSLSTGLKYRLRCSWYCELLSNCWQWGHRCLHLDRLFLPLVSPCNASIIGHPLGGTPGKLNVEWGLIRGFERLTYPGGGGNEGGLFSKSLAPRGKQGTLQTKQVNFKLS